MAEFVNVIIETEANELADLALDKLQEELEAKGVVGYEPNEGNQEVITINVLAPMAANTAQIASVVPPAIFRAFGTQLVRLAYNEGKAATVTTKWKQIAEAGKFPVRTIEAGTQVEASGLAFLVEKETKTESEVAEVTVVLIASERGTEFNGITGTMTLVNNLNFVESITTVGESSGGENQETDEAYQNRLVAQLALQAARPITATNFAEMALLVPATQGLTETIGRTTAIDGYEKYATPVKIEGTPKISETTLKEVSSLVGMSFEKSGGTQSHPGSRLKWEAKEGVLPKGVTAKAKLAANEVELSVAAEKTEAKGKIEILDQYEVQRAVTVFVTNSKGEALSAPNQKKLKEFLEAFRELNFLVYVESASYNNIQVKTKVKVLPGYTASAIKETVKLAIESYLSPTKWGNPTGSTATSTTWLNATQGANIVRYNSLIGVIEGVLGVQFVLPGATGLAIGLEEAPGTKVADLTLLGPAPLPETTAAKVTVETE